jgi:hypothetical protein
VSPTIDCCKYRRGPLIPCSEEFRGKLGHPCSEEVRRLGPQSVSDAPDHSFFGGFFSGGVFSNSRRRATFFSNNRRRRTFFDSLPEQCKDINFDYSDCPPLLTFPPTPVFFNRAPTPAFFARRIDIGLDCCDEELLGRRPIDSSFCDYTKCK